MANTEYNDKVKTTVNISADIKTKMDEFISSKQIKNQTSFINQALASSLKELERSLAIEELKIRIAAIKPIKSDKTILETKDELWAEALEDC